MRQKRFAMIVICAIFITVSLVFNSAAEARGFDEPDLLSRQIRPIAIKRETIDQVLGFLTAEYGIPIGIELGDPKLTPRSEIDMDLPDTNLKEFLDAVIAKDPRYTWKLAGGVIHVLPVSGRDTALTTLLNTKISHFSFSGRVSPYHIHSEIMNLPEVRSQLVIAGIDPLIFVNSGNMHKFEKEIFFAESNLTLRELLDRIILKTESKRWVITRWGKNNEFITLRP